MSSEARIRQTIDDAVRAATEPLKQAVAALGVRLAALEAPGGPAGDSKASRAAEGRTAKSTTAGTRASGGSGT